MAFYIPGTDSTATWVVMMKTTSASPADGDWSAVDSIQVVGNNTIRSITSVEHSSDIYIATHHDDGDVNFYLFDPGTDTFTSEQSVTVLTRPTDGSYNALLPSTDGEYGVSIAVRSDGDVLVGVAGQEETSGDDETYVFVRTSGSWAQDPVVVSTSAADTPLMLVGPDSSDRVYSFRKGGTTINGTPILSDNSLGTGYNVDLSSDDADYPLFPGVIADGEYWLPYIDASNNISVNHATFSDAPTDSNLTDVSSDAVDGHGTANNFTTAGLYADGTTIGLVYVSDADNDINREPNVESAGTDTAEATATALRVSCNKLSSDLGVVYDDNGTTTFLLISLTGATQQSLTGTAVGVAVVDPVATFFRTLAANDNAVATLDPVVTFFRMLAATATDVASLTLARVKALSATAASIATLTALPTFFRTLAATDTGVAVIATLASFRRTLAATVTGVAVIDPIAKFFRTLAATDTGVAVMVATKSFFETLAAIATGVATLDPVAIFRRTLAATGIGVAVMDPIAKFFRTLAASTTGVAVIIATKSFFETLTAIAVGVASLDPIALFRRTLAAVQTGVATLDPIATFKRSLTAIATGVATITADFIAGLVQQTLAATAVGVAVIDPIATFFRTLAATVTGVATLVGLRAKTLAATVTGVAIIDPIATFFRTMAATVTGTANVTASILAQAVTMAAMAIGVAVVQPARAVSLAASVFPLAAIDFAQRFFRTLTATTTGVAVILTGVADFFVALVGSATGVAVIARRLTLHRLLAATATGVANWQRFITQQLQASAFGVALINRRLAEALAATSVNVADIKLARIKILAATLIGVATLTIQTSLSVLMAATATGVAGIKKLVYFHMSAIAVCIGAFGFAKNLWFVTLSAVATGVANIVALYLQFFPPFTGSGGLGILQNNRKRWTAWRSRFAPKR